MLESKVIKFIKCGFLFTGIFIVLTSQTLPAGSEEEAAKPKHPVINSHYMIEKGGRLRKRDLPKYEKALERVMKMSEEEMLSFVPPQTPTYFCGCPNCQTGQYDGYKDMVWTIDKPDQIQCKHCGHIYPDEDQYPMNHTRTVRTPLGNKFTSRYYSQGGWNYLFQAKIWDFKRGWIIEQAHTLAKAYHLTQKPEYARRAALILDRFAQVFPDWCVMRHQAWAMVKDRMYTTLPYDYKKIGGSGGKWSNNWRSEVMGNLIYAYDLIYDSPELDRLSKELGVDVRKRIEDDFFRMRADYILNTVQPRGDNQGNWTEALIKIGKVIGEPEYVHYVYNWMVNMFNGTYMNTFRDGTAYETPGYHGTMVGNMVYPVTELVHYADPPGYVGKKDGKRLDFKNLKFRGVAKNLPRYLKVKNATEIINYPGGTYCPIGDTFPSIRAIKPEEKSTCAILPAYGHALLGAGQGVKQIQAHLRFAGWRGHMHYDDLNMSLFAFGREMLCDIGYHKKTGYRFWGHSTVGHNLVVVDRRVQADRGYKLRVPYCDLLMYIPNLPGISAIEASAVNNAYPKLARTYRRLLVLVTLDEEHPYVIDVFQVKGGNTHDWLMHGSADHDQSATCNLDLVKMPGERPMLEEGEKWREPSENDIWNSPPWNYLNPYGVMKNVRRARRAATSKGWAVTFRYKDKPDLGTRIHMLASRRMELFLCESPSLRRLKRATGKEPMYFPYMPQIVARRKGMKPLTLKSLFVAVIEPFEAGPHIKSIERLNTKYVENGHALALKVVTEKRTDTILIALDGAAGVLTTGKDQTLLAGRIGLIAEEEGRKRGYLIGGTNLESGKLKLASPGVYEGEIEAATRKLDGAETDAFITPTGLPNGDILHNSWMIVTDGEGKMQGYGIDRVEKKDGKTWMHLLDDPGLRIKGDITEDVFFHVKSKIFKTIKGKNRFRILAVVSGQK